VKSAEAYIPLGNKSNYGKRLNWVMNGPNRPSAGWSGVPSKADHQCHQMSGPVWATTGHL